MGLFDFFKKHKQPEPKTARARKLETEKYLTSLGIPFIDHLPLIVEESEVKLRTPQEIAKRILVLAYLVYAAHHPDDNKKVSTFLKQQGLWDSVSDEEIDLFQNDLSDRDQRILSWRVEAICLLLWTINKVDKLELPLEQVDVPKMMGLLPDFMADTNEFIETATLRTASEILDMSDLTYRLHWAARERDFGRIESPDLDSGILEERHYAINWVTYDNDNWDDITTGT